MTAPENDGGQAFPTQYPPGSHAGQGCSGMSLRDWFAGQALPSVVAATSAGQHSPRMREGEINLLPAMARDAYDIADAMLAERGRS